MNKNNENSHATKTSHQLHKNLVFQRGSETIQHVAPVPARGYVTYSSSEIINHRGDGQWQTQRRYGSSTEEIMPRSSNYYANSGKFHPKASQPRSDYSHSFHNQRMPHSSNDYKSDDPVFDEFLHTLMESFEGYDNPNIIGYRTEFSIPFGGYNDPNTTRNTFSRPDSPSKRGAMSLGPENGTWHPGPRASAGKYHEWLPGHSGPRASPGKYPEYHDHPRFGPPTHTKQTQFNYPDSSVRIYDVQPRTEWLSEPGRQPSELSPRQNFGYKNHQFAPDPTDQTQFPNTQPHRNSPRPLLTPRFEVGKLPNAGGYGYSPSGDVDYNRNSPKEGYNYSYAPSAPKDTMTRAEMATNWEAKVNKQPNTGEKISDMASGALNFAKKNLNQMPYSENGNTRPEMMNRWQFSNQPKFGVKSSDNGSLDLAEHREYMAPQTHENGNTRPEFSKASSQRNGNGFPEMAKSWISKQINTGEKNPHNETLDSPKSSQSTSPSSQGNGYTRPEFSRSASKGNGNTLPEFSRSASLGNGNTLPELSRSASQGNGNTRPEFSRSTSQGNGNRFPAMAKSWFSKQPNRGEKNPHDETLNFPNRSQFSTPAPQENEITRPEFSRSASQGKGNANPEMENHWELTNQPNKGETYPNTGDMNSPIEGPSPVPFSQENEYALPGNPNHRDINKEMNTGGNAHNEMVHNPVASNRPYTGEDNSMRGALSSSRRSQVTLDSQPGGNGIPGASNASEISKQPNIKEKFAKLGAMSSAKKSQFPSLFSK